MTKKCALLLVLLFGLWSGCVQSEKSQIPDDSEKEVAATISQTTPAVIYRSTDIGKTWMPYAIGIPQEATVSSFLTMGNTTYATTDTHGIYTVKEGEAKWKRIDTDLPDNVDINAIASINSVFIVGTHKHGILILHNNGINWEPSSLPLRHIPVRCLLSYDNIVFAGTDDGIYKSMDQGNTWQHVYKEMALRFLIIEYMQP